MGEEIKNLLEEEIKNEIENLASLEPGSEKHSTAVESLAKLYKVKLDEDKTSMEYLDKTQNRKSDEGFKVAQIEENVKDRYVKIGIAAAELVLPLMFYAFWMRKGFKFEEKGKRKSMNALTKSSPHLMTKRKSPNRGSFSLLDKLSCAIRKRLFRLSRNM